jgi:hypothetical protein
MVELLVELLDGARADAVRRDHLLQAGFADADQGELGGHEEGVCRDEQDDRYDSQHNESNHPENLKSVSSFQFQVLRQFQVSSFNSRDAIANFEAGDGFHFRVRAMKTNEMTERKPKTAHSSGLELENESCLETAFSLSSTLNRRSQSKSLF